MAKPKSAKLRTLIALRTLYKLSDKTHRINSLQLNEYFRPYGLECGSGFLSDLVHTMQDYGIKVHQSGSFEKRGVFVEDRPLSELQLQQLIFAVSTNPHISKAHATEILQSLAPFVTVYQEPLLNSCVDTDSMLHTDDSDSLFQAFSIIQEALSSNRRIVFTVDRLKYTASDHSVKKSQRIRMRFTPRYLIQSHGSLYMVGYNSTRRIFEAVDLNDIRHIALAMQADDPFVDLIDRYFSVNDPRELIPKARPVIVYEGEAVFRCYGLFDIDLFRRFGPPSGPVTRDNRCRVTYPVSHISLTCDDLHWFSKIPGHGIRIIGPKPLVEVVKNYYAMISADIINPAISQEYRKLYID